MPDRSKWSPTKRIQTTRTTTTKGESPASKTTTDKSQKTPLLPGYATNKEETSKKSDSSFLKPSYGNNEKTSDSEVNLIELSARIAGANMAIRNVEAQLSQDRRWSAKNLSIIVASLKQISERQNDLKLFRKLLPESERNLVGEIESPREIISQCSTLIAETRSRIDRPGTRRLSKAREDELKKLDELSRQLSKLVESI
jgi:hypothetical protein